MSKEKIQPTLASPQLRALNVSSFLDSEQTLKEVLKKDKLVLKILNYTQQEVADLLGPVSATATRGENFEYCAPNGQQYDVRVVVWNGRRSCPWKDTVNRSKSSGAIDMYLTKKGEEGEPVSIDGLIHHLVELHGFFGGGKNGVAPEKIIKMFGTEKIPGSFEIVRELRELRL